MLQILFALLILISPLLSFGQTQNSLLSCAHLGQSVGRDSIGQTALLTGLSGASAMDIHNLVFDPATPPAKLAPKVVNYIAAHTSWTATQKAIFWSMASLEIAKKMPFKNNYYSGPDASHIFVGPHGYFLIFAPNGKVFRGTDLIEEDMDLENEYPDYSALREVTPTILYH